MLNFKNNNYKQKNKIIFFYNVAIVQANIYIKPKYLELIFN